MKPASIQDLKKEMGNMDAIQLKELCLQLGKFKKENKEYLSFLLFMSEDLKGYISDICLEIESMLLDLNTSSAYRTAKGLRKIVRMVTKYIRFAANDQVEAEVRIFLCKKVKQLVINLSTSVVLRKIYERELEKIEKVVSKMHEELQLDYRPDMLALQIL